MGTELTSKADLKFKMTADGMRKNAEELKAAKEKEAKERAEEILRGLEGTLEELLNTTASTCLVRALHYLQDKEGYRALLAVTANSDGRAAIDADAFPVSHYMHWVVGSLRKAKFVVYVIGRESGRSGKVIDVTISWA